VTRLPAAGTGALGEAQLVLLREARRATLATIAPDGRARLVPVCFAVAAEHPDGAVVLYSALDDKPKRSTDPHALARVRDIERDPRVTILVDRWSEDWSRLEWLRLEGTASLVGPPHPDHASGVRRLRTRYPQYRGQRLGERPLIRVTVDRAVGWRSGPPEPLA
jgi:PPOX class probable F420-dependent enzyme